MTESKVAIKPTGKWSSHQATIVSYTSVSVKDQLKLQMQDHQRASYSPIIQYSIILHKAVITQHTLQISEPPADAKAADNIPALARSVVLLQIVFTRTSALNKTTKIHNDQNMIVMG